MYATESIFSNTKKPSSPIQSCGLAQNRTISCDLDKLTVTLGKRKVSSRSPSAKIPEKPSDPRRQMLMAQNLFVLEGVGEFQESGGPIPGDPLQLTVESSHAGLCAEHQKSLISINDPTNQGVEQFGEITPKITVLAKPSDLVTEGGLTDLIQSLLTAMDPKSIEVVGMTCGLRAGGNPVKSIHGLVRVFRKETTVIQLDFPPSLRFGRKKTGENVFTNNKRVTTERQTGTGSTSETKDKGGQVVALGESHQEGLSQRQQSVKQSSSDKADKSLEWSEKAKGSLKLTVKRNGKELAIGKILNNLANKIVCAAMSIDDVIGDLKNCVPQVGFDIGCEVTLFAVAIDCSIGVREDTGISNANYNWVSRYGDFSISGKLFEITASLSFGIDARTPAIINWMTGEYALVAKITASIKVGLDIKRTVTLYGDSIVDADAEAGARLIADVKGSSDWNAKAQILLVFAGIRLLDTRFELKGGIQCAGRIYWPLSIVLNAKRTKTVWYATFYSAGKKESRTETYEIFQEATLLENYHIAAS